MDDPVARARAIAARLSGNDASSEPTRKRSRWGDDQPSSTPSSAAQSALALALAQTSGSMSMSSASPRLSASAAVAAAMMVGTTKKSKKKIYIPQGGEFGDIDFRKLLIGPRGTTQKAMEEKYGTKILIRGRGSTKDGSIGYGEDDNDDLHVCVEGDMDKVEATAAELERIMSSPEAAQKLKADQLISLAQMNGGGGVGGGGEGGGHYGPPAGAIQARPGLGFGGYGGDEITDTVDIPNPQVGLVIGKGGETIQSIIQMSGCHVQIAKEHEMLPGATTRSVFLKGSPNAIEKAKVEINRILTERTQPRSSQSAYGPGSDSHQASVPVKIPNSQVGLIIGKGGVTVKSIQERTGTICQIPQGPDQDDFTMRTITVVGPSEAGCHAAVAEINGLIADKQMGGQGMGNGYGGVPPRVVVIQNEFAGAVIGKGGSTIRGIQERSGARVQIPNEVDVGSNPPTRSITITGSKEGQERAVHDIMDAIKNLGGGQGMSTMNHPNANANGGHYGGGNFGGGQAYAYNMQPDPYMMYQQQQQQQAYYAQQQQQHQQQQQQPTETAPAVVDMTAYYNDFWLYYAAYGEKLAREYYGDWSPPVGTAPPEGITAPSTEDTSAPPTEDIAATSSQSEAVPTELASDAPPPPSDNETTSDAPPPPPPPVLD